MAEKKKKKRKKEKRKKNYEPRKIKDQGFLILGRWLWDKETGSKLKIFLGKGVK